MPFLPLAGFVIFVKFILGGMVLLPILFDTSYKFKVGSLAVMAALHGLAIVFGLFAQRAYIVLVHPEKNTKEAVMNRSTLMPQLYHANRLSAATRKCSMPSTAADAFEKRFSMPTFGGACGGSSSSSSRERVERQVSLPDSIASGSVQETSFSIDDTAPLHNQQVSRRPSGIDRFKHIFSTSCAASSDGGSSLNEPPTAPCELHSEVRQKERRFNSTSVGYSLQSSELRESRKPSASLLLPSRSSRTRITFSPGID